MLTLVHVIILICGAGDWCSDGQVAILYIVHCQSPVIVFILVFLLVTCSGRPATLLCIMFVLVVPWLVAVPVCHWGDLVHTTKVSHHVCTFFWHVNCLGWVIWWLDRNRQGILTEPVYIYVSFVNK